MTATFDDAHPRADKRGIFVERSFGSPEINLGFFTDTDEDRSVTDYADGAPVTKLVPRSVDEVRDAFAGDEQEPDGRVRQVRIIDPLAVLNNEDVYGPTDGRPLLIDLDAGAGSIRVVSGYVVIRINSVFPNDVEVCGAAEATIIVARGRSSIIHATENSHVLVIAEDGARGVLRVESPDADAEIVGPSPKFHIAHTYAWTL